MNESVRIDKWLWAVRIYKTRSMATEACRNGKVHVNGQPAKASRSVSVGETLTVRKSPYTFTYEVCGMIEKRVSAKLASDYVKDITPAGELLKVKTIQESAFFTRDKGAGRPTKKDRRILDRFRG